MSKCCYELELLKHNFTCIRSEGIEKLQVLSNKSLKENKLKRHLHACHPNLKEKNLEFFNERKMR